MHFSSSANLRASLQKGHQVTVQERQIYSLNHTSSASPPSAQQHHIMCTVSSPKDSSTPTLCISQLQACQPPYRLFLPPSLYSPKHISARVPSTSKQAKQFRTCSLISVPPQEAPGSTHLSALIQQSPVLSKTNRCCCPSQSKDIQNISRKQREALPADEGPHLTKTSENIQKQQNLL